jgi:predicted acylesterase/phospholipase RssA
VAPLQGKEIQLLGRTHRIFEHVEAFESDDFRHPARRERMFSFVAASVAIPLLFRPVELSGIGPSIDGGAVNLAPLAHVGEGIDTIYVIAAHPTNHQPALTGGIDYANTLAHILVRERIIRDLQVAVARGVHVVEIRPETELPGSAAKAFFSRALRASYVAAGRLAARAVL